MPRNLNLDERRALKDDVTVTANGVTYTLPKYLPAAVSVSMMKLVNAEADPLGAVNGTREAYAALFGDEHAEQAMADIGLNELNEIMEETYKVPPVNSPALPSS